jgi:chaperone modulatory protein CbpM
MKTEDLIPINELCVHYNIEYSFIYSLNEIGLLDIITLEQKAFIEKEYLSEVERMIRLHSDLGINVEGIEAVTHLLKRVDELQHELWTLKNRNHTEI